MDMFPANIKDGKPARLFSSLKISNKEQIATSTLLAVFRIIPELLADLLSQTEVRFRDRTDVKVYTEITLSKSLDD
ncbi:MAG: hypothetical protein P8N97_07605 [Alphaproteobacteria bacterium]|nr:hypothetical protein [Alphaproteobacteria bacterium]